MSTLYLVALTEPSLDAWRAIREQFPNRNQTVSDTLAFVAPDGVSTPSTVKDQIGIAVSSESASGIVVKLIAEQSSGVLPSAVVDWIRAADE